MIQCALNLRRFNVNLREILSALNLRRLKVNLEDSMYTESQMIQCTLNLRRFNVNLRDSKCIESSKIHCESKRRFNALRRFNVNLRMNL